MLIFHHTLISLTIAAVCTVLAPTVAAAAQSAAAPCGSSAAACVSLSRQQAWLMNGGQVTYGPTPVRTGMAGYRTPAGTFKVLWKDRHHRSRAFNNAPMPYSVFFTNSGIAFHQGSLNGASHGCVRLGRNAAATFFNTLSVGQVVQVVR
ncbi:MAG: L,D-transpeptidase [Actinomycetota bacterium]|nr:L,D-transpeptidase [Actinomycetota bacterium]